MHKTTPGTLSYEEYQAKVANLKTASDVTNFVKDLIAPTLQVMLEAEMTEHLGYKKYEEKGTHPGNSRNGHSKKLLRTSQGYAALEIPRDRNADFNPQIIPKHRTIQGDVEEKIIAMYAKGMTTRDINGYMYDIYGVDVSASMVSSITDSIIPRIAGWQARPLSPLYPFVYLDGIHFKVKNDGKVVTKCAYIALGINESGHKEVLGIWVGEAEGSKFWMGILSELKSRGVADMLIVCTDGLTGFDDAIHAIYPSARIQQCIVHQVRNTLKFVPHKDRKAVASALKTIYTAPTQEAGLAALGEIQAQFPQYALYLKSWETKWHLLSTFFEYPEEIRRIIYTTNTIEGLNRQYRKVTKTTSIFPHDQALTKLLYLATNDIAKKWVMPIRNWGSIVAQLAILFPEKADALINA
ncbi:MAG: IS256 family transposase [bacterium]|nr:IS256 family transposase [bacterium]